MVETEGALKSVTLFGIFLWDFQQRRAALVEPPSSCHSSRVWRLTFKIEATVELDLLSSKESHCTQNLTLVHFSTFGAYLKETNSASSPPKALSDKIDFYEVEVGDL